jgi:hypothetical protein
MSKSKISKIFSAPSKSAKPSKLPVKNDVPKRSSHPKPTSQTGLESRPRSPASTAKAPPASTAAAPRAPVPPPRAPVQAPRAPVTTAVAPPSFVSRTGNALSGLTTKFSDTLSSPAMAQPLDMLSNITKNVFQEHVVAPVLSKIGNDTVDRLQNYVTSPPQTIQQPYEQDFSTAYSQNASAAGMDRFEDNAPWQQPLAQDFRAPDNMRMTYQSDVPDMGNFAANMQQNYAMAPPQTRQQPYEQDFSTAYAQNALATGLDRFEDNTPWQQPPAQDFRTPDNMRMMHQSDVPDMGNFATNMPQNYPMAPPQTRQQPYEQDFSTAYAQNASAAGLDRLEDNAPWQRPPAQDFRALNNTRMMNKFDAPDLDALPEEG